MQAASSYPPPAAEFRLPRRNNPLLFLYPVLDSLNTGGFIRNAVGIAIQIGGGFFLLMGLISCFGLLSYAFRGEPRNAFGGVLFALILLAGLAAVAQVFWYRAAAIKSIDNSSGFTIMPIASQLFRLAGEVYATLAVCIGLGGCLAMWFSGSAPLNVLGGFGPSLPYSAGSLLSSGGDGSFIGGVSLALIGCLGGFAVLVVAYFFAELTIVTASMAKDMRALAAKVGA